MACLFGFALEGCLCVPKCLAVGERERETGARTVVFICTFFPSGERKTRVGRRRGLKKAKRGAFQPEELIDGRWASLSLPSCLLSVGSQPPLILTICDLASLFLPVSLYLVSL